MPVNRLLFTVMISLLPGIIIAQRNWKLEREQNGIKVFSADVKGAVYKATKVECTLVGNYAKLIAILSDVPKFSKWIYNSKNNRLLQKQSAHDFIYYTETSLPWPLSNRETVIRVRMNTDSLPKFMTISGTAEPGHVVKNADLVRVYQYKANWKLTMPSANTIHIHYELVLDPGGSIPGWVANMFTDKGPFETFNNLAKKLKE